MICGIKYFIIIEWLRCSMRQEKFQTIKHVLDSICFGKKQSFDVQTKYCIKSCFGAWPLEIKLSWTF